MATNKSPESIDDKAFQALEEALKIVTPGGTLLPFGMDSSITATIVPNQITRWATKIIGLYLGQNTMLPSGTGRPDSRIFQPSGGGGTASVGPVRMVR